MKATRNSGLLGVAATLALAAASVPAHAQDIATLTKKLDAMNEGVAQLKEELARLKADKVEKRRVAAAASVEAGDKPRSWKIPGTNTSMNIGGFVKFSTTWNFTGSPFSNGQTGVEGSAAGSYSGIEGSQADRRFNGGHWEMTARRSRFWVQTWTPTDWGELRTYIEGDFASRVGQTSSPDAGGISRAGEMLRLRHAYGTLGPVLAGKTNTLFGGLIGAPEVLDDAAPIVLGALRIPQIRYSHNLGGGLVFMVALEEAGNLADSGSVIVGASCAVGSVCTSLSANTWLGVTTGGTFNGPQRWPDVTAALQWSFPNGAVYASGVVGQLDVDNGGVTTLSRSASTFKWGAALGARYNFGRVEIGGQGHVGDGIGGKYAFVNTAGFTDAVLIRTGSSQSQQSLTELASVFSYSGTAYVQVKLTDTVRATASYSWGMTEVASEVPFYYGTSAANSKPALTGVTNIFSSAHGNVLWNPVPQATFGVEYAYQFSAKYNANNLHVQRLQFSAIYRF